MFFETCSMKSNNVEPLPSAGSQCDIVFEVSSIRIVFAKSSKHVVPVNWFVFNRRTTVALFPSDVNYSGPLWLETN